jgi:hypothetical protein
VRRRRKAKRKRRRASYVIYQSPSTIYQRKKRRSSRMIYQNPSAITQRTTIRLFLGTVGMEVESQQNLFVGMKIGK